MRLIARDYDQFTGITEETWYEEVPNGTNKIHLKRFQDVDHILAMNKIKRNEAPSNFSQDDGGAFHAAEIPFVVIEKWMKEGFNWYESTTNEKRAMLNKPEWAYLKTRDVTL